MRNDTSQLQEWQHTIPRSDRELTISCVVCDLHFQDGDIVKNFVHNTCGDAVIPRDKMSLKDGAVSRLFPNCRKLLSKPARKRKAPAARPPFQLKRRNVQDAAGKKKTQCRTLSIMEGEGALWQAATHSIPPSPCSRSYRQRRKRDGACKAGRVNSVLLSYCTTLKQKTQSP